MSSEAFKFSQAARVYAEHIAVVEQMEQLHRQDILSFVDHLRERVNEGVTVGRLGEELLPTSCSWWIETDKSNDDVPYFYFMLNNAEIVSPGLLTLTVAADGKLKSFRPQIAALMADLKLPESCKTSRQSNGLPQFKIALAAEDPVGSATEPVLAVLSALSDAEIKLRESIRSSAKGL